MPEQRKLDRSREGMDARTVSDEQHDHPGGHSARPSSMDEGNRQKAAEKEEPGMVSEEALRVDEARFEALFELGQMTETSVRDIMDFSLEQQVKLTRSRFGFLGFMNEDETVFTMQAWSKSVMAQCAVPGEFMHLTVAGGGLWANAIRNRKAVIFND